MVEVIQFVFSSFWVWLGTVVLLSVPVLGVLMAVGVWKGPVADPEEIARLARAKLDRDAALQAAQRQIHQGRHAQGAVPTWTSGRNGFRRSAISGVIGGER